MPALPRPAAWWVVLLAAPVLWLGALVVAPASFPYVPGSAYSDLVISHLPSAQFIHTAIARWRQVPLWNPSILSGMPLAADPLAGLWYPPAWLTVGLPTAIGFNLFLFAHLALAGLGMAFFARRQGVDRGPAIFCGLAYGGLPKLVGHVALGHIGMVAALSWLPWFLLLVDHAARSLGPCQARRWYALAALAFASLLVADPRWGLPTAAFGVAWWMLCIMEGRSAGTLRLRPTVIPAVLAGALAGMVAAPLLLPMSELASLSTRSALTPEEAAALSMPPARLLSLLDPGAAGSPEWQAYLGLAVLFLAGVAVVIKAPRWGFWLGVAALSVLWSLGSYTPVYRVLSQILPGALALRVPARLLFLFAFGLILLAGLGLQGLGQAIQERRVNPAIRLWAFALAAMAVLLQIFVASTRGDLGAVRWMTLIVVCVIGLGGLALPRSPHPVLWIAIGACALQLMDQGTFDLVQVEARPASEVLTEKAAVVEGASKLAGPEGRAFSPSYSLPQQTTAEEELGLADGVHPLQLRSYWNFMAAATGFDAGAYSVTLPPFPSGEPADDWGPQIDLTRLGLLSVGAIASAFPIEGLTPIAAAEPGYVYQNPEARPRAWLEPADGSPDEWAPVSDWTWTPNRITVGAVGPGRVVLSELVYPGWEVTVDGQPGRIETVYDVLRSTEIAAGEHLLVFEFKPRPVILGVILGALGAALLFWMGWRR